MAASALMGKIRLIVLLNIRLKKLFLFLFISVSIIKNTAALSEILQDFKYDSEEPEWDSVRLRRQRWIQILHELSFLKKSHLRYRSLSRALYRQSALQLTQALQCIFLLNRVWHLLFTVIILYTSKIAYDVLFAIPTQCLFI